MNNFSKQLVFFTVVIASLVLLAIYGDNYFQVVTMAVGGWTIGRGAGIWAQDKWPVPGLTRK